MSWNRAAFTEFIEKYKKLECLWNVNNKEYRNKHKRLRALETLAGLLKKSDATANIHFVTKKINNMRSSFNKEFNKVKASVDKGEEDIHVPKLWYYDLLMFLVNSTPRRPPTDVNVGLAKEYVDSSDEFNLSESALLPKKDTNAGQYLKVEWSESNIEDNDPTSPEDNKDPLPTPNMEANSTNWQKTRKRTLDHPFPHTSIKQEKTTSNNLQLNEFDVFCQSLAIQLKKMPPERAIICQDKLQSVMTRERLYQLTQTEVDVVIPSSSSS